MTTIPAPTPTTASETQTAEQTFGILSLVTAIVSLVTGFVPIGSVVAIVLGAIALRREPASRSLAAAGVIIGAIPLAIGALLLALIPFGVMAALSWGVFGFWL
jgi:hypothetical protein